MSTVYFALSFIYFYSAYFDTFTESQGRKTVESILVFPAIVTFALRYAMGEGPAYIAGIIMFFIIWTVLFFLIRTIIEVKNHAGTATPKL